MQDVLNNRSKYAHYEHCVKHSRFARQSHGSQRALSRMERQVNSNKADCDGQRALISFIDLLYIY